MRMLKYAILVMTLVSGPLVEAQGPDTALASRVLSFTPADDPGTSRCAGVFLTANRFITAAHCVETPPNTINVRCPFAEVDAQALRFHVRRIATHTGHDVAIVTLSERAFCSYADTHLALSDKTASTLFTVDVVTGSRNQMNVLRADSLTYVTEDEQCLTQGDSGTPAFMLDKQGSPRLAGILISGTGECPAIQILSNVSDFADWVETVLVLPISGDQ